MTPLISGTAVYRPLARRMRAPCDAAARAARARVPALRAPMRALGPARPKRPPLASLKAAGAARQTAPSPPAKQRPPPPHVMQLLLVALLARALGARAASTLLCQSTAPFSPTVGGVAAAAGALRARADGVLRLPALHGAVECRRDGGRGLR